MNQADIFTKVKVLVIDSLDIEDGDKVLPEASFADDLAADSLDIVELIMALEEEFEIEIPDEDAPNITTVGDAVEYIGKKIGATA
ncbi:MAG: acyl carrier protein [Microcystaceae cyanobacterium]